MSCNKPSVSAGLDKPPSANEGQLLPADVLIVGAGPTGLVLALLLARFGVRVRIVDKASGPGEASRAMAVQARTLEFYQQLGFADEVVAKSIAMERVHLWRRDREVATLEFGDVGNNLSPFPFALSFPQDEHERFLGDRLREAGVCVEWNTQITDLQERSSTVVAQLSREGEVQAVEAPFLCGCDGAHSAVRHSLGIGFPGGTYEQRMYVADVEAEGPAAGDGINGHLRQGAFVAVFPIRTTGMHRLIGVVPPELQNQPDLTFTRIQPFIEKTIALRIGKVNWSSVYKVHHRVAESFRRGRSFLLGDAGHVHSPAGGQGMNTGIGDAVNLAWKLAQALRTGSAAVLDTYEPERIAFARRLVETTDRGFQGIVGTGLAATLVRGFVIPNIMPILLRSRRIRREAFRIVSQTAIHYRASTMSSGCVGRLQGGDRLPWTGGNYEPMKSLAWQIHVYGSSSSELKGLPCPVHQFDFNEQVCRAGFVMDAMYVVRPDGYIGLACARQDAARAARYLSAHM